MLGRTITGFNSGFGYLLFALLTGAGLCGGYVLLGATWLVLKTEGVLQKKAIAWAKWGLLWVALGVVVVSLATPLVSATVRMKWFGFPRTAALMLLPAASVAVGIVVWIALGRLARARVAGNGCRSRAVLRSSRSLSPASLTVCFRTW